MSEESEKNRAERAQAAQEGRAERARADRAKKIVKEMEKKNHEYIICWRGTKGYWKMGWTSALFVKHRLASRIPALKDTKLRVDTDFKYQSKTGVISKRDMLKFEQQLKTQKIFTYHKEGDIWIFSLGFRLTDGEIERLQKTEKIRLDQLNQMVVPKNPYPSIYKQIVTVRTWLVPMACKLPRGLDHYHGDFLLQQLRTLLVTYRDLANGVQVCGQNGKVLSERGMMARMVRAAQLLVYEMSDMLEGTKVETKSVLGHTRELLMLKLSLEAQLAKLRDLEKAETVEEVFNVSIN